MVVYLIINNFSNTNIQKLGASLFHSLFSRDFENVSVKFQYNFEFDSIKTRI